MKKRLLALFLMASQQMAFAGTPDFAAGVKSYNHGDFKSAQILLSKAVSGSGKYDAIAHYYLANTLLQLGQRQAAINEYKESYRLAPQGAAASECETAINRLLPSVRTGAPAEAASSLPYEVVPAAPQAAPEVVIHGLPSVPQVQKETPTLSEIIAWQAVDQWNYLSQAAERRTRAMEKLTQAQDTMKKVQSLASSAVPNSRQYGESEKETAARVSTGKTSLDKILKPYQDALDQQEKAVEQANSIYQTCSQARARMRNGY